MNNRVRLLAAGFIGLTALASAGCVRRSLSIRTEPPEALVYVNEHLKGKSPVEYDFMWYGWHRVTIRKEGFERLDDKKLIKAPVYLWIPFDLIMEILPIPIRDRREWAFTLTPVTDQSPAAPDSDAAGESEQPQLEEWEK